MATAAAAQGGSAACPGRARSRVCETPKSRATRERILQAALTIVVEEGYHAAHNARVAEAAGVARGVINYHFRDHADFTRALVALVEQRKAASLAALAGRLRQSPRESPRAHVDAAIDGYWELLHQPAFVAFAELEHTARTDAGLRRVLAEPRRAFDHGVSASGALEPAGPAAAPDRQALYDLVRFLLEGLARGALTYDQQTRQARLLGLLKKAVKALDAGQPPAPLWMD
ncbi:MAG: TetR/AcrR family transcriptional regulator [Phenylobacterium sp.]|uniref:TetR/AcrR family transcriptional regulator n=1 Tax=Phenylobacterium sp. TaxID=1871053 RepID=UPI003919257F